MVTTDSKLAQAFAASEMHCVLFAEADQDALIAKDATGDGYMVYGGAQQVRQPDPDAGLAWLREHGFTVTEDSEWLPIEVHFAGKRADTIADVIADGELPAACYRFLLAQACAGEPVFAYLDVSEGNVSKHIWFQNRHYTVAEFGQRWESGEIHP